MIEFIMPSLGADMEDGILSEWRKQPGDTVKRGDIIADLETQKGLIEIEVFDEGIIDQLLLKEGEKVPVGTVMALIRLAGEVPATAPVREKAIAVETAAELHPIQEKVLQPAGQTASPPAGAPAKQNGEHHRIKISPLARTMAEQNHLDLNEIHGSGPDGSITRKDVEEVIAHAPAPAPASSARPAAAPAPGGAGEAIRMAIAAAMSKSKREIPHYYIEKRIDMTKALAWLQEMNRQRTPQKRIMMPALLIKAVARALDEVPQLNAVWDGGLQLKDEINIGFVVALRSGGIIVPAVLRADVKSVEEIMEVLNDLIPRAKALKLRSSELSDSTITLTSLGDGTADKVFGIIYPPQVAIVGFGGISDQPFARDGMLGIAPVLVATLAGDHRPTDGLTGSRFLSSLNLHLQNPAAL